MALESVSINEGTQTPIASDNIAGTAYQVMKMNLGGDGTVGSLWDGNVGVTSFTPDIPGGTIDNVGTVPGVGSVSNIAVVHNAGTVAGLPDLPGGTVDLVTTVSNLTNGSVAITAGTIGAFTADIPGGTTDLVTRVGNVGTIESGTISTLPDLPGGTIDSITAVANLNAGTVTSVQSVTPGTSAANLGKAEDEVHSSGDTGVMTLAVRNDALAALAGTDGDYAPLQVDADGALYTIEKNLIDTNNSSTSTLLGDAVYTGTGTDVLQYATLTVYVEASHDSATDGLQLEFSSDNSNWDIIDSFNYVAADGGIAYTTPTKGQYFRVVYTNGSTGQSHFRLQTILHANPQPASDGRLSDNVSPEKIANLTKSALIAQNAGTGDFIPTQATAGGNLKVAIEEISDGLDIGAGNAGSETQRVSISTDDVNLSAIKTAVETLDNVVSGSEAQVDVVASLPAGNNNIGNVDVVTLPDLPGGTIDSVAALPDLPGGTVDSVTNLAGGTVQINPKPSRNIITYGTTIGGTAATGITLISAPGSGTSIYLNEISLINRGTAQLQTYVGFGTASTAGTSQVAAGNLAASGGGIQKSYPKAVGGHITNLALLGSITAAGTVDVNLSYWVQ